MAAGTMALLTNEALRKHLSQNAAQDVHQRFDLEQQVEAYLEWYQMIVERGDTERSTFQPANV